MEEKDLKGLMIAHRGIHGNGIIENTIPAFSMAIKKNVPIELDIHILKDSNLVVYHDDNLNRLINIDRNISSYTYQELKELTFPNTDIHIPLFDDVLDMINGKVLLVVEIKKSNIINYRKYCEKIVSVLDKYSGDLVIKSFDYRIVKYFLKNTNYLTGLLISNKSNFYDWCMRKNITISLVGPDFISVSSRLLDEKFINKNIGKLPILTWTIRSQKKLEKVKNKADSFLVEGFDFWES